MLELAAAFSPPEAFEDMLPDEEHFQEHSGNEGASFERSCSRAALVLWPSRRLFAVVNQAGLGATLPLLADMAKRWSETGADRQSTLWRDARALSEQMARSWPTANFYGDTEREESDAGRFLATLTELKDAHRISEFFSQVVAIGCFETGDNAAIVAALLILPLERGGELLSRIIGGASVNAFGRCADLLARAVAALGTSEAARRAARALVAAMPTKASDPYFADDGPNAAEIDARSIADLLKGVAPIDPETAVSAVNFALARPQVYPMDETLVPAARELTDQAEFRDAPAAQILRPACSAHLRARIVEMLEPPADWRRPSTIGCRCADCAELGMFLADPAREVWRLRAIQSRRSHVEQTIRNARADVDIRSEKKGSPHILACTKNQDSYDRRVMQRAADIINATALA